MVNERIVETNEGIQGEFDTQEYDVFMRQMRDKGWLDTKQIIQYGIDTGSILEIGPGPGYLGLEWLKNTIGGHLTALEISSNMIKLCQKNALEYGIGKNQCKYVQGNALNMPLEVDSFDAVISNGSLHEWEDPVRVFNEIFRVLKEGGKAYVSDLKRNTPCLIRAMMMRGTKSSWMKKGLESSIDAAYTVREMQGIIEQSKFKKADIKANPFGLVVLLNKNTKRQ